jgi:hypothetical protein
MRQSEILPSETRCEYVPLYPEGTLPVAVSDGSPSLWLCSFAPVLRERFSGDFSILRMVSRCRRLGGVRGLVALQGPRIC